MASSTKQTDMIRRRKKAKAGRKRKAHLQNHGSTPSVAELFGDEKPKNT